MSKLTSKQIIEFGEKAFRWKRAQRLRVEISPEGFIKAATEAPYVTLYDAGFNIAPGGYLLCDVADIPRAAAVLRLQGFEVTILEK